MNLRKFQFDTRLREHNMDNGNADGGTNDGGESGKANADGGNANANQNNSDNNDPPFAGMWDNPDTSGDANANDANANANANSNVAKQTPDQIFDAHFDSLNIGQGFDMQTVTADIQAGGVEALHKFANTMSKDIYRAAITQSSKLMDSKVDAAVKLALSQSEGSFNAKLATNELNSALPFTAAPEIKPIADAIFARFVKGGASVKESISKTEAYFKHTFKLAEKELGLKPPASRPGASGFGASGGNVDDADEEGQPDWLEILGGS